VDDVGLSPSALVIPSGFRIAGELWRRPAKRSDVAYPPEWRRGGGGRTASGSIAEVWRPIPVSSKPGLWSPAARASLDEQLDISSLSLAASQLSMRALGMEGGVSTTPSAGAAGGERRARAADERRLCAPAGSMIPALRAGEAVAATGGEVGGEVAGEAAAGEAAETLSARGADHVGGCIPSSVDRRRGLRLGGGGGIGSGLRCRNLCSRARPSFAWRAGSAVLISWSGSTSSGSSHPDVPLGL